MIITLLCPALGHDKIQGTAGIASLPTQLVRRVSLTQQGGSALPSSFRGMLHKKAGLFIL